MSAALAEGSVEPTLNITSWPTMGLATRRPRLSAVPLQTTYPAS